MNILILGGARSGKSSLAENISRHQEVETGGGVIYLATARAGDEEMEDRIAAHKERRPDSWVTIEEELYPGRQLKFYLERQNSSRAKPGIVMLDCLTLLVSNHIIAQEDKNQQADKNQEKQIFQEIMAELEKIAGLAGEFNLDLIFVSNEVGMGVVPPSRLGRLFRDISGRINREVENMCEKSYFMLAGRPVDIDKIAVSPLEEDWPL